jgi:large repetitive protein
VGNPRPQTEWFLQGRTSSDGPAAEHLQRAYEQKLRARSDRAARVAAARTELLNSGSGITSKQLSAAAAAAITSFGNTSAVWMPVGPRSTATASSDLNQDYGPAVGRVTAIAVDPNDSTGNTVYVGGAYGGVWRSHNAADASRNLCPPNSNATCAPNVQWEPLLDDQPTLAVGAIAVRPGDSNWILVGTGEAHNSADSYYGMGFLLSEDGGASWIVKDSTVSGDPLHGLGITRIAFSTDNPNFVVATAAVAATAVRLGAETGGAAARGIYYSYDAGETWRKAGVQDPGTGPVTSASANSVVYNSANHTFYVNLRFHGFYSSTDGANWIRLANQPGGTLLSQAACPTQPSQNCPLFRAEMSVVPGRNEMYVWIVDSFSKNRGIFQTLDGGANWTQVPTTSMQNCGDAFGCDAEQGIYNLSLAAVPDGSITDLYAGAVNLFKCRITSLTSPNCTFVNLTHVYGCALPGSYSNVHPDQQAVDFSPQHPELIYFGNDGGVYRTLNSFATNSGSCGSPPSPAWFDNLDFSSVPGAGLGSMLQFVSLSQHPTDASVLLGGTQDNGSPATSGASAGSGTWLAANSGDGGFNAINPDNGDEWFTSAPGDESSAFNIDIERCTLGLNCDYSQFHQVVGLSQTGGDASSFYPPYILDPQMPTRLIAGSCRVWRGNSDGTGEWGTPGIPLSINFAADPAGSSSSTACSSGHTELASLAAGGPVTPSLGSQVVWAGQEGNGKDSGGEVWVTLNADNGPSSWRRALSASTTCSGQPFNPQHYNVSDIALDTSDASGRTAYVTVMGFTNGNSGHVFKVQATDTPSFGSTCTDISGNLPDAPADSVVADPASPTTLYAGTDVGVFVTKSAVSGALWDEVGPVSGPGALPNVVVTRLRLFTEPGGGVKLRAATYGRGVWEASLTPDFQLVLSSSTAYAFSGLSNTFSGKLFALSGYSGSVTITCEDTGGGLPSTCNGGGPLTPSATGTSVSVTVANPSVHDFSFSLKATGTDGIVHSYPVTLHVGDFQVNAPNPGSLDVPRGTGGSSSLTLTALGTVSSGIDLSCGLAGGGSPPAGLTCAPTPSSVTLDGTAATANSSIQIQAASNTVAGSYVLRITATSADGMLARSADLTVNVNVNPRFELQPPSNSLGTAKPGQQLSMTIPLQSLDGLGNTTITMSCQLGGSPGAATCEVAPASVNLPSGSTQQVTLTVNTVGALAGNPSVTVTGSDSSSTASATLSYSIQDYRVVAPTLELIPGGGGTGAVALSSDNGYSGTVGVNCDSTGFAGNPCSISPAGPVTISPGGGGTLNLTVTAPLNTPAGTQLLQLKSNDTTLPTVIRQTPVPVKVYDYKLTTATSSATIPAGQSATFSVMLTSGPDPFPQKVTFACSGLPQLSTCAFSPSGLPAGSSSGTVTVTIRTTAVSVADGTPAKPRLPAFAMWLGIAALGLVVSGGRPNRRWTGWLVLLLAVGLGSCGGGGGTGLTPPIPQPGTPSGSFTITIQGSTIGNLGSAERSTQVTLIVQ